MTEGCTARERALGRSPTQLGMGKEAEKTLWGRDQTEHWVANGQEKGGREAGGSD